MIKPSSVCVENWHFGVFLHGWEQWYQKSYCIISFFSPSSLFPHLFPINSQTPECLLLITFIISKCSPSSTMLCILEDLPLSKSMAARWASSPYSPSSLRTWHTVPRRYGPRWSHHPGWWAPHRPASTSSNHHSPKTFILTPISEGLHHLLYKVGQCTTQKFTYLTLFWNNWNSPFFVRVFLIDLSAQLHD